MTAPFTAFGSSQTIQDCASFRNALDVVFALDLNGSQATPKREVRFNLLTVHKRQPKI
jgi:hypothetical protein